VDEVVDEEVIIGSAQNYDARKKSINGKVEARDRKSSGVLVEGGSLLPVETKDLRGSAKPEEGRSPVLARSMKNLLALLSERKAPFKWGRTRAEEPA